MKPCWCLLVAAVVAYPSFAFAQAQTEPGALAPPPAVQPVAPEDAPTPTEQELSRADREDAGRGLEFVWLNGEVGFQHLGLQTFHANSLVDAQIVKSSQSGMVFGAGAGVRLIFLTLGGRFRLGTFDAWQLWTLNAELGFRIPIGALEPYFTFGGGYASLGSFDSKSIGTSLGDFGVSAGGLNVRGFNVRGGIGFDYYVARVLSIGAQASGDVLFLSRPKSKVVATQATGTGAEAAAAAQVYARDGSAIGGDVTLTAMVGLHF
ncbi:MAG TPA: hypothetical protein VFQ61_32495 [Polyangiaceae bacterium]|nr:hypothetical protein [Polyangiaceae bacterium]